LLRKRASNSRGFSLPEILTVTVIAALASTIVVALFRPLVESTGAAQASSDVMMSLNEALYVIQRDIRQSDPNGIFVCSGSAQAPACTPGSELPTLTDAKYLVILTAQTDGGGSMNWDSSGRPQWTGFDVYWLSTDVNGSPVLVHEFAAAAIQAGVNPQILNADVINAVSVAANSTSPDIVAHSVQSVQTAVNVTYDRVSLQISFSSTTGTHTTARSVRGDAYARN